MGVFAFSTAGGELLGDWCAKDADSNDAVPPVDIAFEDDEHATVIRLSAASTGLHWPALSPVFNDLGLKVLSCSIDNSLDEAQPGAEASCANATIVAVGSVQQLSAAERASVVCGLCRTLSTSSSSTGASSSAVAADQQRRQQQQQHQQQQSVPQRGGWPDPNLAVEPDTCKPNSSIHHPALLLQCSSGDTNSSNTAGSCALAVTLPSTQHTIPQQPASSSFMAPVSPDSTEQQMIVPVPGVLLSSPFSASTAADEEPDTAAAAGTTLVAVNSTVPGAAVAQPPALELPGADEEEQWWCGPPSGLAVEQVMSVPVRSICADASISEAKALMERWDVSGLLVDTGDGGEPGFVTKRDLLKASFKRGPKRTRRVRDAMQRPLISVQLGTPIETALQMLQERGIRRALVCDAAKADAADPLAQFVGVVSDKAILRRLGLYSPVRGAAQAVEFESLEQRELQLRGTADSYATSSSTDIRMSQSSLGATPNPSPSGTQTAADNAVPAVSALQRTGNGSSSSSASASDGAAATGCQPLALFNVAANRPSQPYASALSQESYADTIPSSRPLIASGRSHEAPRAPEGSSGVNHYSRAAALWEMDLSEVEMLRKIGEGSFGEVMLGNLRGTKVAVKRLHAPDETSSDYASQAAALDLFFEREISILASIRHPNVLNFIGACHTPYSCCLVTEYCARGNLDTLLHKSGLQLDLLKRIEFATDVARGMTALHSARPKPIIHRDLKPGNLLVSARFEIKVADFGLSRIKDAAQMLTSRADIEGTIEYCAPEVLRGEPSTEKCDVWSFGVVLWELLTRRRPYSDADVPIYLLMANIANRTLELPPVDSTLATPGLQVLLGRCLSQDAAARPDFLEVLLTLEREYRIMRQARSSDSGSSVAATPSVATGSPARSLSPGAAAQRNALPSQRLSGLPPGQHANAAAECQASMHQGGGSGDPQLPPMPVMHSRAGTRSVPMAAVTTWVKEAMQMGGSECVESEELPLSGGTSGDYGAELAAAVALLRVSENQERQAEQQGEWHQQLEREVERQEERKQQQERRAERQNERQEERRRQQERQAERQEDQRLEQAWQVERQAERDEDRRHEQERQSQRQAERLQHQERQVERQEDQRQQQEQQAPSAAPQRGALPRQLVSTAPPEQDAAAESQASLHQDAGSKGLQLPLLPLMRMLRTHSMPLAAVPKWVKEAVQVGGSEFAESEELSMSGAASGDYGAELAAAVALLHGSKNQQQQERQAAQQDERQQQHEREVERQEERRQQQERQAERQEERRQQQERQAERQEEQRVEQAWQVERQVQRDEERRHQQERQIERQAERLHQQERQVERKEEQRQQQERQAQRLEERQQAYSLQQAGSSALLSARSSSSSTSSAVNSLVPIPGAALDAAAALQSPSGAAWNNAQSAQRSDSFSGSSSSYSRQCSPQDTPLLHQEVTAQLQASTSSIGEVASSASASSDATSATAPATKPAASPFANMQPWDD